MYDSFTQHQFNKLSKAEKYKILQDHGTYLEVYYLSGKHRVALFALSTFYVEVWVDQVADKLTNAIAFSSYKKLDRFVKEIDITSIYALLS